MGEDRTTKNIKQIEKHIEALVEGSFSIKYGLTKANRVLFVFEKEVLMKRVLE